MTTTEDFRNAPVGATATHNDGGRAMKMDYVERRWIVPNGFCLDDEEMERRDYTLDPLPDPEPDWLGAPAVMARLGNWISCADPQVFTRKDKTGTQWTREAGVYHWTELEEVTPLYPKEEA